MAASGGADYYASRLSADKLRQCYALASPRVRQYLDAEIRFAVEQLAPNDAVLELGCGYGRVSLELARAAGRVVGIDTSLDSLELARAMVGPESKCEFLEMDASALAFDDCEFDVVVCSDVIEHFIESDREKVLNNLDRHLKKGGKLVLVLPSRLYISFVENIWKIIRKALYPGTKFDDDDLHLLVNTDEIYKHLKDADYDLEKKGNCCFWLSNFIVLRKRQ